MTENRRLRQRAKRKEKRQLKHQLIIQAQNYENITPIGKYKELDKSFFEYAICEAKREIRNGKIDYNRQLTINNTINLSKKLKPKERSA